MSGRQTGSALAQRRPFDVTRAAYKEFDDDLIRLVKSSIMPKEATQAETYFLLELAARYGLDPFAREIWAVKMKGRTGEMGGVQILVGRDGLLAIAERHKDYRGFRSQPVYENDEFSYGADPREMPDGTFSHVHHSFTVTGDRGALLGAWAEVYRKGRPATFFYAPLTDYMPTSERKLEYSPWKTMGNVMIVKCALATALRVSFRITGLYIEEEMANALVPADDVVYQVPSWPEDEALAGRLGALFAAAEDAKPGSWLPGKQAAALEACEDADGYLELAARLEEFIVQHGGKVPEEVAQVEFDRADGGGIEDADYEPVEVDAEVAAIPFGEDGDTAEQGTLVE